MRTKQKAAVLEGQRLAHDRTAAYHDARARARALALELARGVPFARFDPMNAGIVLKLGETVFRQVPLWIRVQQQGRWAEASYADVLVSDMRLLCRFATGHLFSLWWGGVVGLDVDLAAEHVVLDFGDGQPVSLSGCSVPLVAVAGIASVYGIDAMLTHPGLTPLRTSGTAYRL